ncbi:MAG: transcriptional regulator, partial [Actinobacteria bacterium]|nr:transcriptional regulator [Actinomycetota bacterium]
MLRMHLRAADLAETTFCVSPLQETVFSLWVRRRPERQPYHLGWRAATAAAYDRVDRDVLDAVVAPSWGIPDFLTPRPSSPVATFEEELAELAAVPVRAVRPGIVAAYRDRPVPAVLTGRPSAVLARVVGALADYWQACVLPSWPRMGAVLEADIVFRARKLAL